MPRRGAIPISFGMSDPNDSDQGRLQQGEAPASVPQSFLQPVDEETRRLARRLLRGARTAALAVLRPHDGFPAASRVLIATEFSGRPLLLVSGLSLHARALAIDARCSLLVGESGKGDPLAHPRMTVFSKATIVSPDDPERERLRERFLARHPKAALYADFPDFRFVRLEPTGASLNGGFARAFELDPDDLLDEAVEGLEAEAIRARDHMNADHADAVGAIAERCAKTEAAGWRIATVDRAGFEIARGDRLERIEFPGGPVARGGYRQAFVDLVTRPNARSA
ncbi:HugZ family protein [Jiella sp. M17.18]|uniref:HugZ family pyridoxamine 5'-phosphate oxidase n=1 Tax=Jiella sp. M17.18 TaxID=3234247 RepID=UPI0034DEC62A